MTILVRFHDFLDGPCLCDFLAGSCFPAVRLDGWMGGWLWFNSHDKGTFGRIGWKNDSKQRAKE